MMIFSFRSPLQFERMRQLPRQSLRHVTFVDIVLLERRISSCFFLFLVSSLVSWHSFSSLSGMSAFRRLQFPGLATNLNPAPEVSQYSATYQANYVTHQPYPELFNKVQSLETQFTVFWLQQGDDAFLSTVLRNSTGCDKSIEIAPCTRGPRGSALSFVRALSQCSDTPNL